MADEKPHYLGHRTRLRERVLKNTDSAESYELLELLLGYANKRGDTKPLAKSLLKKFGSLWGVLNAHPTELMSVEDVGASTQVFFILLREMVGRYFAEPIKNKHSITLDDICMLARCKLDGLAHEEVWIALLDNNNRLLSFERVTTGLIDATVCTPRMIAELALKKKASAIVLVHNHPGGTSKASWADTETTKHVQRVLQPMGIRLIDHLIVADSKVISLADNHLFNSNENINIFKETGKDII